MMRQVLSFLASVRLAVVLLSLMAVAVFAGTIVYGVSGAENGFRYVYAQPWFHALFAAFAVNTAACVWVRILVRRRRWALGLTHVGLLVVMLGALITAVFGQRGRMALTDGDQSSRIEMDVGPGGDPRSAPSLDLGFSVVLDHFAIEKYPDDSILVAAIPDRGFMQQYPASRPTPFDLGWSGFSVRSMRRVEHFERRPDLEPDENGGPGILVSLSGKNEVIALTGTVGPEPSDSVSQDGNLSIRFSIVQKVLSIEEAKKAFPAKAAVDEAKIFRGNADEPVLIIAPTGGKGVETRLAVSPQATWRDDATGDVVQVLRYVPAFRLDEKNVPFSASDKPDNPAIQIQVQTSQGTFKQWVFARSEFRNFSHRGMGQSPYRFEFRHPAFQSEGAPTVVPATVTMVWMPGSRLIALVDEASKSGSHRSAVMLSQGRSVRWGRNGDQSLTVDRVLPAARRVWREGESPNSKAPAAMQVEIAIGSRTEKLWLTERADPRPIPALGGKVRLAVVRREGMVKRYVSTVHVNDGPRANGFAGAGVVGADIEVNRPLHHGDWTFYQSSYYQDPHSGGQVTVLDVRRDPGVVWIFSGFGLLMLGMVWFYAERMGYRVGKKRPHS